MPGIWPRGPRTNRSPAAFRGTFEVGGAPPGQWHRLTRCQWAEELRRTGVDEDLLLYPHVFSGPPKEIPFFLPHAVDGPHIGMFPLAKAGPAADAYRAVSGSVSPEFRDEVDRLASLLESEHGEWEYATKALDWYDQDTIFFSVTG